jgi:hypothetical protein
VCLFKTRNKDDQSLPFLDDLEEAGEGNESFEFFSFKRRKKYEYIRLRIEGSQNMFRLFIRVSLHKLKKRVLQEWIYKLERRYQERRYLANTSYQKRDVDISFKYTLDPYTAAKFYEQIEKDDNGCMARCKAKLAELWSYITETKFGDWTFLVFGK